MIHCCGKSSLDEAHKVLCNLVNAQVKLGMDLLATVAGLSACCLPKLPAKRGCCARPGCCEIPAPCWVPQPLGECVSHVCPCRTACIRLVVTNCDASSRRLIRVDASGPLAKVAPEQLVLEPLERGTVEVCIAVPGDAEPGSKLESVVRIHGCREYYLRWIVSVGLIGFDSRHEIEIEDCPDLVHHWYDHFYCRRSCQHAPASEGTSSHA